MTMPLPPIPPAEIIEENIIAISISGPYTVLVPHNGWAKWFRDELGQTWVKFDIRNDGKTYPKVIAAHLVRAVTYTAREDRPSS